MHTYDALMRTTVTIDGAAFVTFDRGFARFPGLRTLDPLAA